MNYKEKALEHVRRVCPDLEKDTGIEGFHEVVYSYHTPHLEHWERALSTLGMIDSHSLTPTTKELFLNTGDGQAKRVVFDLKTGQPATEKDYKAYCDIISSS